MLLAYSKRRADTIQLIRIRASPLPVATQRLGAELNFALEFRSRKWWTFLATQLPMNPTCVLLMR